MAPDTDTLLTRIADLLEGIGRALPTVPPAPDWDAGPAFRWRKCGASGFPQPIRHPAELRLDDLLWIDAQKAEIDRNTRQFVAGRSANNVLLWGSRGTGKSSLMKALLTEYAPEGLRMIEVDKHDLVDLPDIVDMIYDRPERFVLYCDDLSFEADDPSYKALKAVLDGSLSATPDNVLIYATSNRRHLLPELMKENLETRHVSGEIHHGEAVEEKISLSERFGLWLSFYPFNQDQYLEIVSHWLRRLNGAAELDDVLRKEALRWALARGSRSGRVAYQFARDRAGRGPSVD
jgi:predicted AAA+ superfamily ATPase